jgi:hypothetical protein
VKNDSCRRGAAGATQSGAWEPEENHKKKDKSDDSRPEYRREDLGSGLRGKYLEASGSGSNLVLLSPDVAKVFPTEEAVNEALRSLIELARKSTRPTKPSSRRTRSED